MYFLAVALIALQITYISSRNSGKPKRNKSVAPAESIFIDSFTQIVDASGPLSQLLDLSQTTGVEYHDFIYRRALAAHAEWGMTPLDVSAAIAAGPIIKFPNLPKSTMTRVYSSVVARYLLTEGVLNESNAQFLARWFAETMENSANQISSFLPEYQYQAISNGFINFLSSFVQFTPKKGWKLASLYGKAWKTEAIRLGIW
ncbi:hypothetical protein NPIL_246741 [Nephila pilipes]|uniref:Uncharacterized protein n=1 Tax=Nephila pilipes TaxID=299642 RepID=A0A8X6PFF7_NEPPI|nr:hypothetical protein NPIL_246741 [Nephila pilipes]